MSFSTPVGSLLETGTTALGFWLTFPSTAIARTILHAGAGVGKHGFSWILIDAEHGLITDKHYYELSTAVASEGASPIIRVPWGEEWMIKRALDAGAHGIVTPMCHSAVRLHDAKVNTWVFDSNEKQADAEKIVRYSKYPPRGTRGFGPLFTPHSFPGLTSGGTYVSGAEKGLTVVVQIETAQGLQNVEEIARVDGIDVLFIGPFDLAMQNNLERGSSEHEAAMERILKAAKSAGKRAAIFCTDANDAAARVKQGFNMVSINTDVGLLTSAVTKELETTLGGPSTASQLGKHVREADFKRLVLRCTIVFAPKDRD